MESLFVFCKFITSTNMNSVQMNQVTTMLNKLHEDAKNDYLRIGKGVVKSIVRPMQPADFKHAYLPISVEQGQMLRKLVVKHNCQSVLEFGTSFGISTIYLADAVRQIGGKVISTELLANKAQKAAQNIKEAGLEDYVEIRIGDAMDTLKDYSESIDLLFLDGWKDLYLPLFKMLEPQFHPGTLIYADNMDMQSTQEYGDYILKQSQAYSTQIVEHGKAYLSTKKI